MISPHTLRPTQPSVRPLVGGDPDRTEREGGVGGSEVEARGVGGRGGGDETDKIVGITSSEEVARATNGWVRKTNNRDSVSRRETVESSRLIETTRKRGTKWCNVQVNFNGV